MEDIKNIIDILYINEELILKILREDDVSDEYVNWLNNYELMRFTEQIYEKHTIEKVISFVKNKLNSNSEFLFGIFYLGKHIGNIKMGPIDYNHKVSDISYFIGENKYWGKGIASKVVDRVVRFGFENLFLNKINASCYETNYASEKVLKKCGFELEGIRKKQYIFEGKRVNALLFGKLSN